MVIKMRKKLIELVNQAVRYALDNCRSKNPNAILETQDIADYLIANNVVVQKHGYWAWEGRFKACSECGSYIDWDDTLGANHWSFCPYCGTQMDGDMNE
jgi:NADH pyrophosphatase NudC (nudix superfamily)